MLIEFIIYINNYITLVFYINKNNFFICFYSFSKNFNFNYYSLSSLNKISKLF